MAVLGDYWFTPLLFVAGVSLVSVLFLSLRLIVLRLFGVPKDKVAEWALKEASSGKLVELIRAFRGKKPEPPDT